MILLRSARTATSERCGGGQHELRQHAGVLCEHQIQLGSPGDVRRHVGRPTKINHVIRIDDTSGQLLCAFKSGWSGDSAQTVQIGERTQRVSKFKICPSRQRHLAIVKKIRQWVSERNNLTIDVLFGLLERLWLRPPSEPE